MDADRISIARRCLEATHTGTMTFPEVIGTLSAAGFEGYTVDYRRNTRICYMPDGASVMLDMPGASPSVAASFDATGIEAAVRWAQAGGPGYSYEGFHGRATAAGCAGYLVSFSGRRVVYFGRTAEVHVEHFPG